MTGRELLAGMTDLDGSILAEAEIVGKNIRVRRFRPALAAAIGAAVLILAGCAYVALTEPEWFGQFFSRWQEQGLSQSQTAFVEENTKSHRPECDPGRLHPDGGVCHRRFLQRLHQTAADSETIPVPASGRRTARTTPAPSAPRKRSPPESAPPPQWPPPAPAGTAVPGCFSPRFPLRQNAPIQVCHARQ